MPMERENLRKLLAPDVDTESLLRVIGYIEGDGSPASVVVPNHIGEEYWDYTNSAWYRSTGLTNTSWVLMSYTG